MLSRRNFVKKIFGAISAIVFGKFCPAQVSLAATTDKIDFNIERARTDLERKYGEKEAEVALELIKKYVEKINNDVISVGEAVKQLSKEMMTSSQMPKIAQDIRKSQKAIEMFKNRKREYLILDS